MKPWAREGVEDQVPRLTALKSLKQGTTIMEVET